MNALIHRPIADAAHPTHAPRICAPSAGEGQTAGDATAVGPDAAGRFCGLNAPASPISGARVSPGHGRAQPTGAYDYVCGISFLLGVAHTQHTLIHLWYAYMLLTFAILNLSGG